MFRKSIYKSSAQLRAMVEPGLITAAALDAVAEMIRPGVTTLELDAAAEAVIRLRGAEPNFMLVPGYFHTVCASVNDQVVHGIPTDRVLQAGDIVSIDCGAQFNGWSGDSARTFIVPGEANVQDVAERQELSDVTEGSLWAGIAAMATADRIGEISAAIEDYIVARPFSRTGKPFGILREYVGHGIGRKMHEAPTVFNYRTPERGEVVKPGLVLAIEPMVTSGSEATFVEDDEWTVTTIDGSMGSHWEHSVAVHENGIWVLTAADGGAAGLAPFGITPTPIS
ncbi:type I methionyl aminopeptidase [Microbacterium sp. YY-03]|uniref:type I methionyl aminopeptidase n=1 Tax=Microbacterium sp. YY-03 TaxID=3421636 RepID=UPI003D16C098